MESFRISARRIAVLSLCLTVVSAFVMAAGVFTFQMREGVAQSRSDQLRGRVEGFLIVLSDAMEGTEERRASMWSALMSRNPDLSAILLTDRVGTVQFARGDLEVFSHAVERAAPERISEFRCWRVEMAPRDQEGSRKGVTVAALPVRQSESAHVDRVLLAAFTDRSGSVSIFHRGWLQSGGLVVAGVSGIILGVWVLVRHLIGPLRIISHQALQAAEGGGTAELPVTRNDEIGRLAQAFRQIQGDLAEWRQKAARLERTMDRRVSEQTRRIHEELNRAERKAWTDPLTGLANRRLFDDKLHDIFDAERKRGHDLSVVVMDIDYFKQVNDSLGHSAGDELLQFTADLLRQCLRGNDLAIRMGGDEFVLVLPSTCALDAQSVAQRTIGLFGQRAKLLGVSPRPSMSGGVASIQQSGARTATELLRYADEALYAAKRQGKCQVLVYDAGMEQVGEKPPPRDAARVTR